MSRCLFKHLKLPSCIKNRITGRQSAAVMYYSLHDVLFSSDVICVSAEQTSDRGFYSLQCRIEVLEVDSKGAMIRVVTYTVADKMKSMNSNGTDPVDCPAPLKTIVNSFLSRSSDNKLNDRPKSYFL